MVVDSRFQPLRMMRKSYPGAYGENDPGGNDSHQPPAIVRFVRRGAFGSGHFSFGEIIAPVYLNLMGTLKRLDVSDLGGAGVSGARPKAVSFPESSRRIPREDRYSRPPTPREPQARRVR